MNNSPVSRSRRLSRALAALLLLSGLGFASLGASVSADARPGGGMSMGSRGSRTYSAPAPTQVLPGGASPFSRSMTQRPYGGGYGTSMGGGFAGRGHPLAAGLLGGFIGAGLGGLLLGHGFFGGGMGGGGLGGGGFLGLLLQLALIFFVVRWLLRRFTGVNARSMSSAAGAAPGMMPSPGYGAAPQATGFGGNAPLAIGPGDYQQFEQTLRNIQATWTRADLNGMQRLATPEMVSYFNQQLQDYAQRGTRNAVSDVRLDRGDLSEAWSEGNADYATVAMRYSMIDVTTDMSGRVVDGSPNERIMANEFWTFVRPRGGNWMLSAIQQGR
ncbi:Tim44 domain-containing protein [Lichenicoccus roseus]|uniref:Tim44 domain-containing protein n=1 Tax=Lichenicoccus roseus TaxID=2683649 RepID=A0A5R9JDN2_9PROT|nr:Tim44-like domain-containing protein [Lichenicoccus roseus]TLU73731.1 Tim44 domain-containing protein [Lichenicoccus roseus]